MRGVGLSLRTQSCDVWHDRGQLQSQVWLSIHPAPVFCLHDGKWRQTFLAQICCRKRKEKAHGLLQNRRVFHVAVSKSTTATVFWKLSSSQTAKSMGISEVLSVRKLSKAEKAETTPALTLISNSSIFFSIALTLSCMSKMLTESPWSPKFILFTWEKIFDKYASWLSHTVSSKTSDMGKFLSCKNTWTSLCNSKPWRYLPSW